MWFGKFQGFRFNTSLNLSTENDIQTRALDPIIIVEKKFHTGPSFYWILNGNRLFD